MLPVVKYGPPPEFTPTSFPMPKYGVFPTTVDPSLPPVVTVTPAPANGLFSSPETLLALLGVILLTILGGWVLLKMLLSNKK
jgi:hypothetical protein